MRGNNPIPHAEYTILEKVHTLQDQLRETELMVIKSLIEQGYSMGKISIPLGITRQSLRNRLLSGYYGEVVEPVPENFEAALASVMKERDA
jgi:hypothetical protein